MDFREWLNLYRRTLLAFGNRYYRGDLVTSVYFGGGTPSLLPSSFVNNLLDEIQKLFNLSENAEITLEANPDAINPSKAKEFKKSGINRLSIGVQSIIDSDLMMLGRTHGSHSAKECVFEMAQIFNNISIDLIYNRPGQKVEDWEEELIEVLSFPIDHISLYELIIEDRTPMKTMIDNGILPAPDNSSEFFERTLEITQNAGFTMYEVSNFVRTTLGEGAKILDNFYVSRHEIHKNYLKFSPPPSKVSQHNLSYWQYLDYFGIGPGAHSRVTLQNGKKLAIMQTKNNFEIEYLSREDKFKERLLMGLRSNICGVNLFDIDDDIKLRFNIKNKLEKLLKNEYIVMYGDRVVLTYTGILRLNLIIRYLADSGVI
jgi:oxygen-independent coproporphyrinogen-3 oxidase